MVAAPPNRETKLILLSGASSTGQHELRGFHCSTITTSMNDQTQEQDSTCIMKMLENFITGEHNTHQNLAYELKPSLQQNIDHDVWK